MKKVLFGAIGLIALAGLLFVGCGPDPDPNQNNNNGPKGDKAFTPSSWTKGIEDFAVQQGQNPGEIEYKFSAAAATEGTGAISYKLHYVLGAETKATNIINKEEVIDISPAATFTTIKDGTEAVAFIAENGYYYSFVVVAEKSGIDENARSAVVSTTPKQAPIIDGGTALKVTNLPKGINIAYVFDYTSSTTTGVAEATLNSKGVFALRTSNSAHPLTFTGDAWKGTGNHYILLTNALVSTVYYYVGPSGSASTAFPGTQYGFPGTITTIDFALSSFVKMQDPPLTIQVDSIPEGVTIYGATLLAETGGVGSNHEVATGMNAGLVSGGTKGLFAFKVFVNDPSKNYMGNDDFRDWGNYRIRLTADTTGTKNYWYHTLKDTQTYFDFSKVSDKEKAVVFGWQDFDDGSVPSGPEPDLVLTITNVPATTVMVALFDSTTFMTMFAGMIGPTGGGMDLQAMQAAAVALSNGTPTDGAFNIFGVEGKEFDPEGEYDIVLVGSGAMAGAMGGEATYTDTFIYMVFNPSGAAGQQLLPTPFNFKNAQTVSFTTPPETLPGTATFYFVPASTFLTP